MSNANYCGNVHMTREVSKTLKVPIGMVLSLLKGLEIEDIPDLKAKHLTMLVVNNYSPLGQDMLSISWTESQETRTAAVKMEGKPPITSQ